MTDMGVFTLSLDTELAWGSFDKGGLERFGAAYRRTPVVVDRLCDLFERYSVSATWAFVAHLFDDCETHVSDDQERITWLANAPCRTGTDRSLWYRPDLLDTVLNCPTPQDIGLHGYSHLKFDDHSRDAADEELTDAVRAASEAGLDPTAFVFPRNGVAHVDLLEEYGVDAYRGVDARWYERHAVPGTGRKPLRYLDEATIRTPPTTVPTERGGVVCVPGSQIYRPDHGAWAWTPRESQRRRARKGLDCAVETGRLFHLWFHPFNLAHDIDNSLSMLEDILAYATSLRDAGNLDILSLSEVADAYRDGRWSDTPHRQSPVTP
jgi:peptidoglycan/xylan/chitin deacetylase (PgdA/CDA1 family)